MAFLRQCLQEVRSRQHAPGVVEDALVHEHQEHRYRVTRWPAEPSANDAFARPPAGGRAYVVYPQESNAMRAPEPGGVQV